MSLAEVLPPADRRILVDWLVEVASDLGSFYDGLDVLAEASALATWSATCDCGPPHDDRARVLAVALADDPEGTEAIGHNACLHAQGEPVERWTEPRPEQGTQERLRSRMTCARVYRWRDEAGRIQTAFRTDAPVERPEDETARLDAEREAHLSRVRVRFPQAGGFAWAEQLRHDPEERARGAEAVGAPVVNGRVKSAPCPDCGRPSCCWRIEPTPRFGGALCSHRNSCGWHGSVWDFATAAGLAPPVG